MNRYKIDIPLQDLIYYLMDLKRRTQTSYTSTDVKNAMKPTGQNIRIELSKFLLPALLDTESCWTDADKEFILSNYTVEDVYDEDNILLGIRYQYMARFIKAFEEVLDEVRD